METVLKMGRHIADQKYPLLQRLKDIPLPKTREIKRIYVHHSVSSFGDAELIEKWHLERGFNSIGYNFVITRCERSYDGFPEGFIQLGRDINSRPAHVSGDNSRSIGICLIGLYDENGYKNLVGEEWSFTTQRAKTVRILLATLCKELDLPVDSILGHREAGSVEGVSDPGKTCPGLSLNLDELRASVQVLLRVEDLYNHRCDKYEKMIAMFRLENSQHLFLEGGSSL